MSKKKWDGNSSHQPSFQARIYPETMERLRLFLEMDKLLQDKRTKYIYCTCDVLGIKVRVRVSVMSTVFLNVKPCTRTLVGTRRYQRFRVIY
jgi:hypothetical protein